MENSPGDSRSSYLGPFSSRHPPCTPPFVPTPLRERPGSYCDLRAALGTPPPVHPETATSQPALGSLHRGGQGLVLLRAIAWYYSSCRRLHPSPPLAPLSVSCPISSPHVAVDASSHKIIQHRWRLAASSLVLLSCFLFCRYPTQHPTPHPTPDVQIPKHNSPAHSLHPGHKLDKQTASVENGPSLATTCRLLA